MDAKTWYCIQGYRGPTLSTRMTPNSTFEAQAEMPLGIRIELQDKNFVVTEVLSGGAAALGNLDVQEGDIIHYITTDVEGGGKRSGESFLVQYHRRLTEILMLPWCPCHCLS
eukprot:4865754-Amphidinium_carterae.1